MLVGPLLEVYVVEEPRQGPEVRLPPVAQLTGVPVHDPFHRQGVEDVKGLLVVPAQQGQRLVSGVQHGQILLMYCDDVRGYAKIPRRP